MLLNRRYWMKRRTIAWPKPVVLMMILLAAMSAVGPGCAATHATTRAPTPNDQTDGKQRGRSNEPKIVNRETDRPPTGISPTDRGSAGGSVSPRTADGQADAASSNSVDRHTQGGSDEDAAAGDSESLSVRDSRTGSSYGAPKAYPELGIELLGVRLTAANYMIDVRYRVVDTEKSLRWMDRGLKTYLLDEASGAKFFTPSPPKIGPLRQTSRKPEAGRSYFMMFANPDGFVKRGARVSVVVGEMELQHLIVE